MKNRSITLIFLISISGICLSAENKINEDWVKKDSIFINQLTNSYLKNPLLIEKQLEPWENARVNLGFGYSIIEHSMGKGYVSIFYKLIYKDKKLIAFELNPQMPNNVKLSQRYLFFYKKLFKTENGQPSKMYFHFDEIAKPINYMVKEYNESEDFKFLMTPFSGVVYGESGGTYNQTLENREAYNNVVQKITEKELIFMLNSINPATRLCAAEFYNSHKEKISQKSFVEKLIDRNYTELPKIETMSGCIQYEDNAKDVVKRMSNKEK